MRRKRYLMAVDSVISAIKMGSSCEASCCSLSNQWHGWQQPQPLQALTGWNPTRHGAKSPNPLQNARDGGVTGLFLPEICAWLQSCGLAVFAIKQSGIWGRMALQSRLVLPAGISGGFSSALPANISRVSPARLFISLETPWGSVLALKIYLHS